ncbi:MAG: hypothetical protein K9W44_01315 [Candidatus Lokiarchaeota archaeon]|nr:hypothetical protein [Candidatus Harpocratesius repetitus]
MIILIFDYTDDEEQNWIENYCETCGLCQKSCSAQVIYSQKIVKIENVAGIGSIQTCVDHDKYFPYV